MTARGSIPLVQIKVDGIERAASLIFTPAGTTLTLSRSLGLDLRDGPHRIEARVIDRAGNATDATPVDFGVDTHAPVASVSSPAAHSFVGAPTPAIQFNLQDTAPSSGINPTFATVLLDGVDITANVTFETTGGGATQTLVVTGTGTVRTPLGDGLHILRITAIDNANNPVEAISAFTVDNGAPVLTSDIPAEGRLVGPANVTAQSRTTVTGTATDLAPNLSVTCEVGGTAGAATFANGSFSCDVPVVDGSNSITVTATASTGHSASLTRLGIAGEVAAGGDHWGGGGGGTDMWSWMTSHCSPRLWTMAV